MTDKATLMTDIEKLVRPNILKLKPYSSARDEFKGNEGVFLDANENPYGELNRYPDPLQKELKERLSMIKSISVENIFIGNGSDEIIDLTFRVFCEPGKDKALVFTPTYGMYEVSAAINDIELIKVPLTSSFQIDLLALDKYIDDQALKLIFICSPNNPTGNSMDNINSILERFNGIVVVDEAYIDFSNSDSFIAKISSYHNLIVMQTLSKAWGLAAARIGIGYADASIIAILNKVKPPYNVSGINQKSALNALENTDDFNKRKSIILEQRRWLENQFARIEIIRKVYPSDANFLLVEVVNADTVYEQLVHQKIITRNRHSIVKNCLRITVGTPYENIALVNALRNIES